MKYNFFLKLMLAASMMTVAACTEYDDSALLQRIEDLENRVSALEASQRTANSNIEALQQFVNSIRNNLMVVGAPTGFNDETGSGWILKMSDGSEIKIYNGKDGADAPVIGVKAEGGVYYWTITSNGKTEYLKDAGGNKIPTTGTAPQMRIKDGSWELSTDGGKTWSYAGPATGESGIYFKSVKVSGDTLIVVMSDGQSFVLPLIEAGSVFNEDAIVLSVAAISDVHIGNGYNSEDKFTAALQQLKAKAAVKDADGLDAVMIVGDLINTVNQGQISTLKSLYEAQLDPKKVPMIYTIGNHDMNPGCNWSTSTVSQNSVFHTVLGDDYFLTDQDQTMRKNFECRHCIVGNYHIVAITPNNANPVLYDANSTTWLDSVLGQITAAEPDKYVMLITHPMIYNTVYGSTLGTYWYTSSLTDIINKYPQVVTFGGHLHFPLNDPRSIWQGGFTAMGCASVSYMAFEGGDYENKASATVLKDAGEYSEGLLIQFDANGNMRATRMDFYRNAEIGKAWETAAPKSDKSHLDKYNHIALSAANTAPSLSTASVSVGEVTGGKASVSVTFAAGTDDEFVHHYSVSIKKGSSAVVTKNYMSDFYRAPQPSQMKTEWTVDMGSVDEGKYLLSITAYDSWDAASAPLEKDFTVGAESGSASIWTTDAAGSKAHNGGSGSVSGSWLSYADGTVSWTANNTGKPRTEKITLPDGNSYTVSQLEVKDFKGDWNFRAKLFDGSNKLGIEKNNDNNATVVFGNPLSSEALADAVSGKNISNNIGISGLFSTAVMDAALVIDYEYESLQLGLFFDERSAQSVNTGDATYPYAYFAPELGGSFVGGAYNFSPCPFGTSQHYGWLWINANNSLDAFKYNKDNVTTWKVPGSLSSKTMVGISVLVSKTATPSSSSLRSPNSSSGAGGYDLIYQANAGYGNTGVTADEGLENGMVFSRK